MFGFCGVVALCAEFVYLGAVATVVDRADQHLDTLAAYRFQFLDVHHQAAVAFDQQQLAVATRGGHADGLRKRRADGAEVIDHVHVLGVTAMEVRNDDARKVRAAADHRPVLGYRRIEFEHGRAWVHHIGGHQKLFGVRARRHGGDLRGEHGRACTGG